MLTNREKKKVILSRTRDVSSQRLNILNTINANSLSEEENLQYINRFKDLILIEKALILVSEALTTEEEMI